MKYAKLIDSYPLFAPRHLTVGENVIYNPPEEIYLEQGWLPVKFTDQPEPQGYGYYSETWTEKDGEIVQGWEWVEETDVPADEAMSILFGGDE